MLVTTLSILSSPIAALAPEALVLKSDDFVGISFWVISMALVAATAFFFLEIQRVSGKWKTSLTVSGLVTLVASVHYFYMRDVWVETGSTPTVYRYIDWLITVPLMVLEFPLLLNLGKKGKPLFLGLGVLSLVMLVTAWIAETSPLGGGSWWGFYVVSCLAWVGIVGMLYGSVTRASKHLPEDFQGHLGTMKAFILIGWVIYPIGFLLALSGNESIREIAYNIADVINKVGFGVACVVAAKCLGDHEERGDLKSAA